MATTSGAGSAQDTVNTLESSRFKVVLDKVCNGRLDWIASLSNRSVGWLSLVSGSTGRRAKRTHEFGQYGTTRCPSGSHATDLLAPKAKPAATNTTRRPSISRLVRGGDLPQLAERQRTVGTAVRAHPGHLATREFGFEGLAHQTRGR